MDELQERARQQLGRPVAERVFERRVHALEVPVEAGDAEQVERQVEDVVHLALGAAPP
jgi:hypothetical protein